MQMVAIKKDEIVIWPGMLDADDRNRGKRE